MNASRTVGKDISNIATRLGKDAPQIQTRNIHGITTRFLGGPLSEKQEKELKAETGEDYESTKI